jgi:subtilisin family serine protease
LVDAHRLATGDGVLVAVIDSGIDDAHPDLAGTIAAKFDTLATDEKPHAHGTEMAGAIASHGRLLGVAPRARLLAVRAFGTSAAGEESTTFRILRGLDWAAGQNARIINMSFAGPADPALQDALAKARKKGIVLIAAAGNAGPKSPPLYPAADPNVIAVTATDADDKVFAQANRGNYIAVAAPGVDVLVPAPDANVALTSGTSVAAAHVSGLVALLIELKPSLKPDDVRKILMSSAKSLGPKTRGEAGAGLADALAAVTALAPRTAARPAPAEQAAGQ